MTASKEETLDTAALFDESPASVPASMPSMPKRSALAFAQSRRAAESAWATADKSGSYCACGKGLNTI
jgi:hypothetical protein